MSKLGILIEWIIWMPVSWFTSLYKVLLSCILTLALFAVGAVRLRSTKSSSSSLYTNSELI